MDFKPYILILSMLCVSFVAHKGEPAASELSPSQPAACLLQSSDNMDSPAETTGTFNLVASEYSRLFADGRRSNNFQRNTSPVITAGSLIPRGLLSRYFHICKPLTRQHFTSGTVLARTCVLII